MGVDQLVTGGDVDDPVVDSLTSDSVNTVDLTDKQDGQAWETLRAAGYDSGDMVPIFSVNGQSSRRLTTTSTTYEGSQDFINPNFAAADAFNQVDGNFAVRFFGRILSPDSETTDIRLIDDEFGDVIFEKTDVSQGGILVEPTTFTPSDANSRSAYRIEIRTDPGDNTVFVSDAVLVFGVIL